MPRPASAALYCYPALVAEHANRPGCDCMTLQPLSRKCSAAHYNSVSIMKTVSATYANQQFSRLLREVATGEVVTILARGKPAAIMAPAQAQDAPRQAARFSLLQQLHSQQPSSSRNWTRNEFYEG